MTEDQIRAAGAAVAATFPPLTDAALDQLAVILAPLAEQPARKKTTRRPAQQRTEAA